MMVATEVPPQIEKIIAVISGPHRHLGEREAGQRS